MADMKTGDISASIGLTVTTELLTEIGFPPKNVPGRAKLWDEEQYPAICEKLGDWIKGRANVRKTAAPAKPKSTTAPPPPANSTTADDDEL